MRFDVLVSLNLWPSCSQYRIGNSVRTTPGTGRGPVSSSESPQLGQPSPVWWLLRRSRRSVQWLPAASAALEAERGRRNWSFLPRC